MGFILSIEISAAMYIFLLFYYRRDGVDIMPGGRVKHGLCHALPQIIFVLENF